MNKLIVLLMFLGISLGSQAAPESKLIVGMGSYHFLPLDHRILNEANPAIGIEAWDVQAVYVSKNSWNKKSLYLTYTPDYKVNDYITISANLGIATGYSCSNKMTYNGRSYHEEYCGDIMPLYALTMEYSPFANNAAIAVSVNHMVGMVAFTYSFK